MSLSMLSKQQIGGIVLGVVVATVIANYKDLLPYRWQVYASPDGIFSAQFPAKPEVEDQQMQMANGRSTTLHQIIAAPSQSTAYSCAYFDDPRLAGASPEQVLDADLMGSVSKVQGRIVRQQSLNINGHPARDAEVQSSGNSLLEVRVMIVGGRTFVLTVADTASQKADTKNVQRFFNSAKFSN